MNKLDGLVCTCCPNGVEHINIGQLIKQKKIVTITPSIKVKRNDYLVNGSTPIISQEVEYISGYCNLDDENIPKDNYVCFGDHSEHIKYVDFAFVQGADGLKILRTDETAISARYLFHAASNCYCRRNNYERHFKYFTDTMIPLPPLPVQREIVRILDNFTELTAELTAELAARRKQYEHYRDELLTFGDEVPRIPLGEVGPVCMCKRILKSQTNDVGGVPFYKIGTFGKQANAYISKETYEEYRNKYNFPKKGDILISAAGTIGRTVVYDGEPAYFQDSNIVWVANDETKILNRFLIHCYAMKPWYVSTGGTIARLYNDNILKAVVPVPSLERQKFIVDTLDRFDTLCNDLTSGLPAEIAARQKQYEYYRDKLLTFGEKEN